jgi:hypothetical protein
MLGFALARPNGIYGPERSAPPFTKFIESGPRQILGGHGDVELALRSKFEKERFALSPISPSPREPVMHRAPIGAFENILAR